jgi:uncharacterized short protein YbdD (DUF466 family)
MAETWLCKIKELLYKAFYEHIVEHFRKEHPDWKVICKICGKSFEQIKEEDLKKRLQVK